MKHALASIQWGLLLLCLAVAGCAGTNGTTVGGDPYSGNAMPNQFQQQQSVTMATHALEDKSAQQVTTGLNDFGFGLFAIVARAQPNQNICLSSTSLGNVLGILYNGSAGDTQKEVAKALNVSKLDASKINGANKNIQTLLANVDPSKVDLNIANSMWVDSSEPLSSDFVQKTQENYAAKVSTLDFRAPTAPAQINDWVKDSTKGKIPTIVDQIPSDARLYVINAVYFKGSWQRPFDKNQTQPKEFHLADGTTEQTPMMTQIGSFNYFTNADATGIALPYGSGRLEMDILLPGPKLDLAALAKKITSGVWAGWLKGASQKQVAVTLPTFECSFSEVLNGPLKECGLGDLFDPMKADLSPIVAKSGATPAEKLYVSELKHKTYIKVDEEGTEAAAASGAQITATAVMMPSTKFVADNPFLYIIRDSDTGAVLFEGTVVDPKLTTNETNNSNKGESSKGDTQGSALPPSSAGK